MMGLGQNFLTWIASFFCCLGQVSQPPLGLENFHLKIPNFSILLPMGQSNLSVVGQKYPGQRRVGLLFIAYQKYALVGVGPGQSPSQALELLVIKIL